MSGLLSIIGPSDGGDDNQTFDVTVDDITKYSVGNEVEITIKGCIGMVQLPPHAGMGDPMIGVKVYSQDIKKTGNAQIDAIRQMVDGADNPDDGEGDF